MISFETDIFHVAFLGVRALQSLTPSQDPYGSGFWKRLNFPIGTLLNAFTSTVSGFVLVKKPLILPPVTETVAILRFLDLE